MVNCLSKNSVVVLIDIFIINPVGFFLNAVAIIKSKVMDEDSGVKECEALPTFSPKKVLYFSDGTLEVDDDSIEISEAELPQKPLPVNLQKLPWFPWMWHQTLTAGTKVLEACDFVGESLASFFGITTPKYQFEINEYIRLQKEEARNEIEMGSWTKAIECGKSETVATKPKPLCTDNDFLANMA